ncbi:MAG: Flp pilus assembly complex ATPase component TadA [Chitinispirillaceae bacterium]|nr:Flp pilus assembly complex ATPase component TadA [Chitinispirillaceae bacterium]
MQKVTESNVNRIQVTALGYGPDSLTHLEEHFHRLGLDEALLIHKINLAYAHKCAHCELAFAVLDNAESINKFKHDIAQLKLVKKIPVVVAVANEPLRVVMDDNRLDIAADDFIYLPLNDELFKKAVRTHIVSLKLARQTEKMRTDFNKSPISLGQILVENKLIDALQLKKALDYQKTSGHRLGDTLVELGYIDEDQKLHFLASQLGVPLATPRQYASADLNVVALIPEHIARRHKCIGLERTETELVVAMVDVLDLRLLDSLRDATDLIIRPILGKPDEITTTIERFYHDIASHKDASTLMADLGESIEYLQRQEEEVDLEEMQAAGAELGIIKLVNIILANAVRDKASDIHVEPMEKDLFIRYRIDGDLRKVLSPPKRSHQAILTRIKILSNLDIAERRLPQDGRMCVKVGHREVDIRVSVLPTIFGEKAVLRILDKEAFEKSVTNLGFTSYDEGIFRAQIAKPYGMIIVTGPTGSGKSTTLYSAIQSIKSVTRNIITAEDPVEFHMDGINQVHVNTKIGLTFGSALRTILRQDPDIVLIGEIRDEETADIAIKMALTGHLVFSTLHTNDAASSIARFVDIGIPPLLLASSLNLIVAQRLVRRICTKCRTEFTPDPELLGQLSESLPPTTKLFKGEGCVTCNGTGFYGRTGIFELLEISKEIRKMILKNASTIELQEQAEREGMKTLRQAGIEMALRGDTTIEQVIAVTTEV